MNLKTSKQRPGKIEFITGCMFSGKTDEFVRKVNRLKFAGYKVQIFKPEIDNRYNPGKICSHAKAQLDDCFVVKNVEEIIEKLKKDTDIIGIDEVQFFPKEIVKILDNLADANYYVLTSGLDKNFKAESFPTALKLMSRADKILKLNAICVICGGDADRTQRLIDNEPALWTSPTILIGGKDYYEARCRHHHEIIREKE